MRRKLLQKRATLLAARMIWSTDDLLGELQGTLAALADLECCYEADLERLKQGSEIDAARRHLYGERERRHQQEREPYIQRLNQLEHRVRALTSCL